MICDKCGKDKDDVQYIVNYEGFMVYREPNPSESEVIVGKQCDECWEHRHEKITETEPVDAT